VTDISIINDDSLKIFEQVLGSVSYNAVLVTDPPYGYNYVSNGAKKGSKNRELFGKNPIANDESLEARDYILNICEQYEIDCIVFGSHKKPKPKNCHTVLVWDKGDGPGMGDLSVPWGCSHEEIYIIGKSFAGKRTGSVLRHKNIPASFNAGREHPNEKPVSLMRELLQKCPKDKVVIDPFCGSGSTMVACQELGISGIGIEIDKYYYGVAKSRVASLPLFVESEVV